MDMEPSTQNKNYIQRGPMKVRTSRKM